MRKQCDFEASRGNPYAALLQEPVVIEFKPGLDHLPQGHRQIFQVGVTTKSIDPLDVTFIQDLVDDTDTYD